ncbi:hypothetical protein X797_004715 [Metarhizium robertsii]|uniref:Uncharacterized protein n=2 Tax=Metarhizium robertsii TaxID=568076 RepID=E9FBG3_METRA|nr:uncharacterized protein MAA_09612 [Metarhizium robertsii ARSEF 23]EFY94901.1 hypothetical protein MAA_09612 [Metarhizium robertsii ARSEF 23]EXV01881.1 hypothetical protein X797_004715 [Metarhizium robertsii]
MKFTLPLLALLAGFAAAKIDGSSVNDIDNNELGEGAPNHCPVGRPCSSDRQCGSCSCNDWTGKCTE